MNLEELKARLLAENVETKFDGAYKYRMEYTGELDGTKFRISVHDYRYQFEATEWARDLIEAMDADLQII